MARSYPSRRFPGGPYIEPSVNPALRGPKRTGPIGELVPGDDVEVARILARLGRRPLKEPITYAIKLTGDQVTDRQITAPVDGFFYWPVEWDYNLASLVRVSLYCSTASSSGNVVMNLRKIPRTYPTEPIVDLLSPSCTILQGKNFSWDLTTEQESSDLDLANSQVQLGDQLVIDFDQVGTGVRGLTVHFWFR